MDSSHTFGGIVRRRRTGLILAALLALVSAGLALAPYVAVYSVAVELFTDDGDPSRIPAIALWTALAIAARAVLAGFSSHVAHVAAYRVLADLRLALAATLKAIPLGKVQQRSSGEMKKLLHDDVEQVEEALAHGVPDLAAAIAVPLATTTLFFVVDWRLGFVALGSLLVLVVVSGVGMALAQKSNQDAAEKLVALNSAVMGYLNGLAVIRGYLRPDSGYDQARNAIVDGYESQRKAENGPTSWVVSVMMVGSGFAVAAMLPITGLGVVDGGVSVPTLVLMLLLCLGYLSPLMNLVGLLATLMIRIQFAAGEIAAVLDEQPLLEPAAPVEPAGYDVRFVGVGFSYDVSSPESSSDGEGEGGEDAALEGKRVLVDVDLEIPAGSTTALVGPTGAGKSTLARLVARQWDPGSGTVTLGGADLREIGSARVARLVAFVQQDEYVFAATLADNIRVARPEASDDEVIAASTAARLADVADELGGWEAELPAGGGRLSGGQRQRISIARALLKDAPVVVLDEATASLDAETERLTLAALDRLTQGRTVIAIAHRLETIRGADRIAVVVDGGIEAVGTHDELHESNDTYRSLWSAYTEAQGWRTDRPDGDGGTVDEAGSTVEAERSRRSRGASGVVTSTDEGAADEWTRAAHDVVTPGVGAMSFGKQWRTLYGRSWSELKKYGLVRIVLESMVRGIPLVTVFLTVDRAVNGTLTSGFVWQMFGLLTAGLTVRFFLSHWANVYVWGLAGRAKTDLMLSLIERLRQVPLGFLGRVDRGRVATLITNDTVMLDFQNVPGQVAGACLQPVYAGVILAIVDWRLALAALAGVPVFLLVTAWSDRIYHRVFADLHRTRAEASTVLVEQARGALVLRGAEDSEIAGRYRDVVERLRLTSVAMSVKTLPSNALGSIAVESGLVALILVGAWLFDRGDVTATTLLLFLMLMLAFYQPIQELSALAGYRRNQEQIAAKIGEVWDEPVLPEPETPAVPADASLKFDGVGFAYDDRQVLTDVCFQARPGTVTALVGPSGAGKSTVASLAARLWDVDEGRVEIGGRSLPEIGSDGVMAMVTTVYQDVYLFPDTVRFNVALGRPEASDDEIWAALAAAQCDDVVAALPGGLDAVVGEGGSSLSGGQRQRLSIARALLKDSPVLILDEAVSAVDPDTESRIQRAIAALTAGRTVLVIAHRLETVRHADRIVVIDDGRVDGIGAHAKLVETSAVYRRLLGEVG
ncbi:MAG: ABC transporter ATP-binding protein [Gordonia sp. (in: high G+C Gram-positive bacteria)]|uniref:ABC transporter ATP-binding protein n=1 Tax=Gordonia sp. (in: high G+C Gram-positive bacteria) TaxID=84139 RepID=UPI0039E3AFC7